MENFKKYLPWIIGAVVLVFILSRLRGGGGTMLAPQTQLTETPQPDAYALPRFEAFQSLIGLASTQVQADAETERARIAGEVTGRAQDIQYALGRYALDVGLEKTDIIAEAQRRAAEIAMWSREQDRQVQQGAIDRYYSSRQGPGITTSIIQALGNIFSNRGGGSVFTPPTFPF